MVREPVFAPHRPASLFDDSLGGFPQADANNYSGVFRAVRFVTCVS